MSKVSKKQQEDNKVNNTGKTAPLEVKAVVNTEITMPFPYLVLLALAVLVYLPSLWLGFTELDDSIFIREFSRFNSDLGNLVASFHRGLFDAVKDPYYRPLFLDSIILNYHACGQDIAGYHLVNVLLHAGSVLLLYKVLLMLNTRQIHALILAAIFAVHPVLVQAVAWIPGRNDTLLAIFLLSFFVYSLDFTDTGKPLSFIMAALFLLLGYFTKETAIFAAPVCFIMITVYKGKGWKEKRAVSQYVLWITCFITWFVVRSTATIAHNTINVAAVGGDFIYHLPVLLQYYGKIWMPVNLSVFATQEDTVYYYGLVAVLLTVVLIYVTKDRDLKKLAGAFGIFILFLVPVLLVPRGIDKQAYEHRLYLPFLGFLLVLPQLNLMKTIKDKQLLMTGSLICIVLTLLNIRHQRNFSDPVTFWGQAAETSPNSAYANMMYAARIDNTAESAELFKKAYLLDSTQKYLNYYMAEMMQKQNAILPSEHFLLAEKRISNFYKCDFLLARVAMVKKNIPEAEGYLDAYLRRDSLDVQANYNLYFLYAQQQQADKAAEQANICIRRFLLRLKAVPDDKLTNSDLALIYLQVKQTDNARAQMQHMKQIGLQLPNEFIPANIVSQMGL